MGGDGSKTRPASANVGKVNLVVPTANVFGSDDDSGFGGLGDDPAVSPTAAPTLVPGFVPLQSSATSDVVGAGGSGNEFQTVTPGYQVEHVTVTQASTVSAATEIPGARLLVEFRSYWPDDGPDWCRVWADGECVSPLTSGDDWFPLQGHALACDSAWLGKWLYFPSLSRSYPCLDTGVTFQCDGVCVVGLVSKTKLPGNQYDVVLLDDPPADTSGPYWESKR